MEGSWWRDLPQPRPGMDEERRAALFDPVEHRAQQFDMVRRGERARRHRHTHEARVEHAVDVVRAGILERDRPPGRKARRQLGNALLVCRQERIGVAPGQGLGADRG